MVELLLRRAEVRRVTPRETRDGLIAWFTRRAEPRIRRAMRFTDPRATESDIRRMARLRARRFFDRLASPFDDPTWADLGRVFLRMQLWMHPARRERPALERDLALWRELFSGRLPAHVSPRRRDRTPRLRLAPRRV